MVIADHTADPMIVAWDLVGQAGARLQLAVWLISTDRRLARGGRAAQCRNAIAECRVSTATTPAAPGTSTARSSSPTAARKPRASATAMPRAPADTGAGSRLVVRQPDELRLAVPGRGDHGRLRRQVLGPQPRAPDQGRGANYTGGLSVGKFIKTVTWQRATRGGEPGNRPGLCPHQPARGHGGPRPHRRDVPTRQILPGREFRPERCVMSLFDVAERVAVVTGGVLRNRRRISPARSPHTAHGRCGRSPREKPSTASAKASPRALRISQRSRTGTASLCSLAAPFRRAPQIILSRGRASTRREPWPDDHGRVLGRRRLDLNLKVALLFCPARWLPGMGDWGRIVTFRSRSSPPVAFPNSAPLRRVARAASVRILTRAHGGGVVGGRHHRQRDSARAIFPTELTPRPVFADSRARRPQRRSDLHRPQRRTRRSRRADAVPVLAASAYVTGQVLHVDGGFTREMKALVQTAPHRLEVLDTPAPEAEIVRVAFCGVLRL